MFGRVKALTGWDDEMALFWFNTANPLLGDVRPVDMCLDGNADRLEEFIAEEEDAKARVEDPQAKEWLEHSARSADDGAESVH